jgi:hypothetical protein
MTAQILEISHVLQVPIGPVRKLAMLSLGRGAADETPFNPSEELSLVVGCWMTSVHGTATDPVVLLVKELQPWFQKIAPEISVAWCGDAKDPVPGYELHVADGRYAVWGDNEQFWDLTDLRYLNPLPTPPVWRTSIHLAGLYFRYQARRARSKDGESSTDIQVAAG